MYKTVTISFRTRKELLEWLDRVSLESKCSRSSLIETILRNFLAGRGEKVFQPESQIEIKDLPSIEGEIPSDGSPFVDVGGVRIGLPKNLRCQIFFDKDRSVFQLDFSPHEGDMEETSPPQESRVVVLNSGREAGLA
jgi:hypothetical protein